MTNREEELRIAEYRRYSVKLTQVLRAGHDAALLMNSTVPTAERSTHCESKKLSFHKVV